MLFFDSTTADHPGFFCLHYQGDDKTLTQCDQQDHFSKYTDRTGERNS